ncbi:MAG: CHASE2 domain-containing protein [Halioglobus sp.]
MHTLLEFVRRIFQFGRGRPAALVILLWTSSLSVLSELPLDGGTADLTGNVTAAFTKARQFLFDGYQKNYPREPQSQPVTIVAIDELSLSKLGQWPWPRTQLAALLDAIAVHQPAAVGLDMYMPEADQTSPDIVAAQLPSTTPDEVIEALLRLSSHEMILAQSLRSMPSVLGAAGFDHDTYTTSAGLRSNPVLVSGGDALPHVRQFKAVLASLPELQAAARGQAILSVDLDFGVVRRIPLVSAVGDTLVSGLAMEMLRVATGDAAVRVSVSDHGIAAVAVADLSVPTQSAGDIWLHFARIEPMKTRYVSASSVLDGTVDPDMLSGKLVLLGLTGSGLHDMRTTALGELVPGIEIQAQVLESLFDGRILARPWWMKWLETAIILLLGLLLIWYIPRRESPLARFIRAVPRASAWITLAINLMLVAIGYLLFRYQGILLDASSFFLILSSVIGSLIASTVIELARMEQQAAEEEQRVREAAKLIAGELAVTLEQPIHGRLSTNSSQVRQLTRRLALEVGEDSRYSQQLDSGAIDRLCQAAVYRDVGMAQVPADILATPGSLAPEARKRVDEHAELGALAIETIRNAIEHRIAKSDPESSRFFACLEAVARCHHEHWDGSGYPSGLSGEDIPLEARIVALIDSWESLVNDRPWRPAMDSKEAIAIIRSGAGTRFDPTLAEHFLRVLEKNSYQD